MGGNLQEVVFTQSILSITRVVLKDLLDLVVTLHVKRERLGAEIPCNLLSARRGGKGTSVLVDSVTGEVGKKAVEVQLTSGSVSAGIGDVIDVSENRVKEGDRVAELRELEEEADDGSFLG